MARSYGGGTLREVRPGYFQLRVMGADPVTGRSRQVSKSFSGSRTQARRALAAFVDEVATGRHIATDATVAYLMGRWLDHVKARLAENTFKSYELASRRHIVPELGETRLRKLTPDVIDGLYAKMLAAGAAPASIRKVHLALRRALEQALKWKWIALNPADDADPPPIPRFDIRPPAGSDVQRLFKAACAYSPEAGALIRLAVATGARRGELCALRWEDFDLGCGAVVISRSVTASGLVKDTKTHAIRRISLDPAAVIFLGGYHNLLKQRCVDMGGTYGRGAYLFSKDPAGAKPWNPTSATHIFIRLRTELSLRGRLHDLRHYSVTTQLAAGVPVVTVAGRHGHAHAATTHNVYAHFIPASDQDAARVMGALFEPDPPTA